MNPQPSTLNHQPASSRGRRAPMTPEQFDLVCRVARFICDRFDLDTADLEGNDRSITRGRAPVLPRWLWIEIIARESTLNMSQIGRAVNRNHSGVVHARTRISDICEYESGSQQGVEIRSTLLAWEQVKKAEGSRLKAKTETMEAAC